MELQEGKNAEAVQERFYNTLYDALCKNQEGYNLICMLNESGLKNDQMECLYTTSLCKKDNFSWIFVWKENNVRTTGVDLKKSESFKKFCCYNKEL